MRLAIMQPYIFPYIGYYQLIGAVDKFVIYDDVNFINKGWINRNNILVNEKAFLFTVPLKEASQNKLIREIDIADAAWGKKLLKTIEQAYKKAPFFQTIHELVSQVVLGETGNISVLCRLSLEKVMEYLGLQTLLVPSSTIYSNTHLKAQERILDICRVENATNYINPIGGMEIYTRELFNQAGIKLNFLRSGAVEYKQFKNQFVPSLSIIDVLMFNSKDEIKKMLDIFDLV